VQGRELDRFAVPPCFDPVRPDPCFSLNAGSRPGLAGASTGLTRAAPRRVRPLSYRLAPPAGSLQRKL